jgi:hypothetical protein
MPDEFVSPARDKLAHDWAQGEGGVWVPIERLTEPGELIVVRVRGRAHTGQSVRRNRPRAVPRRARRPPNGPYARKAAAVVKHRCA